VIESLPQTLVEKPIGRGRQSEASPRGDCEQMQRNTMAILVDTAEMTRRVAGGASNGVRGNSWRAS
jgi:hypothetical protein